MIGDSSSIEKRKRTKKIKIDQPFTWEPCQPHLILFFSRRKEDWGPQEKTRQPERTGPQEATGLPEKMDYLDTIGKAYGKTEKDKRSLDLVHIHGPALWKVRSLSHYYCIKLYETYQFTELQWQKLIEGSHWKKKMVEQSCTVIL